MASLLKSSNPEIFKFRFFNESKSSSSLHAEKKMVNNSVECTIKDNGMGISEQDQTYIFERYRKAKSATKENFGAGLGLAIVKKILDIHDASIKVISKPNQGAAFQFALPVYSG